MAVKPSAIHGKGLFAVVQAIRKVEIVCVKGGHIFDHQKLREITPVNNRDSGFLTHVDSIAVLNPRECVPLFERIRVLGEIVRSKLEKPFELAGVWIERQHRARIQVIARAEIVCP